VFLLREREKKRRNYSANGRKINKPCPHIDERKILFVTKA